MKPKMMNGTRLAVKQIDLALPLKRFGWSMVISGQAFICRVLIMAGSTRFPN